MFDRSNNVALILFFLSGWKIRYREEGTGQKTTFFFVLAGSIKPKRHTDLKMCVPGAKFVKESDFDVKKRLNPRKSPKMMKNQFRNRKILTIFFFRRRKIESCKSSETRFPKFWGQTEPSSRGKRPFEVARRGTNAPTVPYFSTWTKRWWGVKGRRGLSLY